MRQLIVMRHAKSDWKQPGTSDHDRPLNKRGRKAAPLMSQHLADQGLCVDVILASTAIRVQQTLELLQTHWARDAEVLFESDLYLASVQEIARHVQGLHDSWASAMVIGHNPGLSVFVSTLVGESCEMPTAAVAVLKSSTDSWNGSMAEGQWSLDNYWVPRELIP